MKNLKQYFPDWISTAIILIAIAVALTIAARAQDKESAWKEGFSPDTLKISLTPGTPPKGRVVIWKDVVTHEWMTIDSEGNVEPAEKGCGSERMLVKTLHDKDVKLIQWGTVKQAAVAEVIRNAAPPNVRLKSSYDHRLAWEEKVVWQVSGEMIGFKLEADQDFHIVIRDRKDHAKTMVVEIPAPECIAEPYKGVAAELRAKVELTFGRATSVFKLVQPLPVVVTGPGFYDFIHGQKGVAPNGFEIHPVVDIEAEDN